MSFNKFWRTPPPPPNDFDDSTKYISNGEGDLWYEVIGAREPLKSYSELMEKINADAARIEKVILDELNLKRTFATMEDTRMGILLSTAVIGFTVIMVIFALLAFVMALFALPLDKMLRSKVQVNVAMPGEPEVFEAGFSTTYIGSWFGE
jgi:hypothetical protein